MKLSKNITSRCAGVAIAAVIFLSGCSSSSEDVRLTLCKKLVTTFIELPLDLKWKESEEKYTQFEDLVVTVNLDVQFKINNPISMQASCHYEYDETIEEDVSTQVDPLSVYKTAPHKMILDGELIEQPVFEKVVHFLVLDQARQALQFLHKRMKKSQREEKVVPIIGTGDEAPFVEAAEK